MFPSLKNLKSSYYTQSDDVINSFFIPILKHAVSYDRVSAYFSAKSLASYAEGLEFFGKAGHCFRLVISKDISEADYNEIKKGYDLKSSLDDEMIASLRQNLSLQEEKNISNLAYLISLGIVDVKIAFKTAGIFHDKGGVFTDSEGNKIAFRGSINETDAATHVNYESFGVACSWLDCNGFYLNGIKKSEEEFKLLWENKKSGMIVRPAQEVVIREILTHNKGKVIVDEAFLDENAVTLDYDGRLKLWMRPQNIIRFKETLAYTLISLSGWIESVLEDAYVFSEDLSYRDFLDIENQVKSDGIPPGCIFRTTQRYKDYINDHEIFVEKRKNIGIELKKGSNRYNEQFDEFSQIVHLCMTRKLREKQLKDAFFMYVMQKAGNFSVPGSGKTTSVLALYSVLKYTSRVDRIVVIGPKNCFRSWCDEFNVCFEGKEPLRLFDIHDTRLQSSDKSTYLRYNIQSYNMLLFNYEMLASVEDVLSNVVQEKTLLVFDEIHRVKKYEGSYATAALKIAKNSHYTVALTGTPIPNSYADLYNLLHILFPHEYNTLFGFTAAMLTNPSEEQVLEINRGIQPFFCRTTKEQLHVPSANEDIIKDCTVSDDEQTIFEILCKKFRSNKLALLIRILQLESNPAMLLQSVDSSIFSDVLDIDYNTDEVNYVDYSNEIKKRIKSIQRTRKKIACIDHVSSLVNEGKKVIVWCIFRDSINSICSELREKNITAEVIYGDIEAQMRDSILTRFKNGEFDVLITNPHTLAESVSLHNVCHDAVYYEYSYNLVHLLQSKDRIHRLGLPDGQYTQYCFLQSWFDKDGQSYSLDDAIYKRLKDKEQIMLNAIDHDVLEHVTTPEEDVELIFKDLF